MTALDRLLQQLNRVDVIHSHIRQKNRNSTSFFSVYLFFFFYRFINHEIGIIFAFFYDDDDERNE